jgi:CHC2 zinc finger
MTSPNQITLLKTMSCAAVVGVLRKRRRPKVVASGRRNGREKLAVRSFTVNRRAPQPLDKPSIIEIIGERLELRKAGSEFVGPCPFHNDCHPSLYVNPEKGVFLCRACQESGDVFDFIQKLDGLTFSEACKALGIDNRGTRPAPRVSPNRDAAALLTGWMNEQYLLLGVRLRELSRQIVLAQELPDPELVDSFEREWEILSNLHKDLQNPVFAADLWESRASVEALTADVEPEPLPLFPPLTESYRNYLRSLVC